MMQILKLFTTYLSCELVWSLQQHSSPQQSGQCLHQFWVLIWSQTCVILHDCPVMAYFHMWSRIVTYFIMWQKGKKKSSFLSYRSL